MRAVLERDFLAEIVRKRTFWFRMLAALAVSIAVLGVALDNPQWLMDSPDRAGREIFLAGTFTLLALLAVLTPPTVIGSILEERQQETLPLVLAAPVHPAGFALAKLLARAGTVLVWALAALVPMSALLLLGGVDMEAIGSAMILAVAVVLELAAWAVWLSTVTRKLATGAVLAYLLPAIRWFLFLFVAALALFPPQPLREYSTPATRQVAFLVAATTPMPTALRIGDRRDYDREVSRAMSGAPSSGQMAMVQTPRGPVWVRTAASVVLTPPLVARFPALSYLLASIVFAALAVLSAGQRLARESEPRVPWLSRWKRTRNLLRKPPGEGNPMAWKEASLLNTAASRPLYYGTMLLFALSVVGFALALHVENFQERDRRELLFGILAGQASLLGLVAVMAASASIAMERTTGTLDLVRVSTLTPKEFLRGKAMGVFRGLAFLSLFPLLLIGIGVLLGDLPVPVVLACLLVVVLSAAFWTGTGLVCGLFAFRLGPAVSLAGAAYGLLLAGAPLVALLVHEAFDARDAGEFIVTLCPPACHWLFLDGVHRLTLPSPFPMNQQAMWETRLYDEHEAAFFWTFALCAATVLLLGLGPRLAARRWERERVDG